jgi:predicted transcriptional regulator
MSDLEIFREEWVKEIVLKESLTPEQKLRKKIEDAFESFRKVGFKPLTLEEAAYNAARKELRDFFKGGGK